MRNFSDEAFLLFFANEYPEVFHQIDDQFHEFKVVRRGDPRTGGKAVDKLEAKQGLPAGNRRRRGGLARYIQDLDINEGYAPKKTDHRDRNTYTSYHGSPGGSQQRGKRKSKGVAWYKNSVLGGQASEFGDDWMGDLLPSAPKKWRLQEFAKKRKLALGRKMMRFKEANNA